MGQAFHGWSAEAGSLLSSSCSEPVSTGLSVTIEKPVETGWDLKERETWDTREPAVERPAYQPAYRREDPVNGVRRRANRDARRLATPARVAHPAEPGHTVTQVADRRVLLRVLGRLLARRVQLLTP